MSANPCRSQRRPQSILAPAVLVAAALLATTLVACSRNSGDYGDQPTTVVPSPFPQEYSWALITLDGALIGEQAVVEPQFETSQIRGRYSESGILIAFGHGTSHLDAELTPLEGTGRYLVDRNRGRFSLKLAEGDWSTDRGGICSFNFTKVAAPQIPLVPPDGGEIFDVDIGFVCAALGSDSGRKELTISEGRLHTFLVRFPYGT